MNHESHSAVSDGPADTLRRTAEEIRWFGTRVVVGNGNEQIDEHSDTGLKTDQYDRAERLQSKPVRPRRSLHHAILADESVLPVEVLRTSSTSK